MSNPAISPIQDIIADIRAGKMVIPDRQGNSGTPSRLADVGKIAAVMSNPVLALQVGSTLLGGRAVNNYNALKNPRQERVKTNAKRAERAKAGTPEPKVGAAVVAESPEERKRRLRAEALRK